MAKLAPQPIEFADTAPVVAKAVGVIDGTIQEVWDAIVDYERWPAWFTQLTDCHATSDPPTGVGSTREVTIAGRVRVAEQFIAWEEPNVWAFTVTDAPGVVSSLVERVDIKVLGPKLTEITYRMAFAPKGPAFLGRLVAPQLERNLRGALRNLNAEVVRRRRAAEAAEAVEAAQAEAEAPVEATEG